VKRSFRLFILIILLVLSPWPATAGRKNQNGKWVQEMGYYPTDVVGNKQARIRAIMDARRKAIEEGCGVEILSSSLVEMGVLTNDICHAIYSAHVEAKKVLKDTVIAIKNPDGSHSGRYVVDAKFYVVCDEGKEDPGFNIDVALNKHTFEEGEDLKITVKPTRDCYISVFSVYENGEIHLIFPNAIEKDNRVESGEKRTIPGNDYYGFTLEPLKDQLQSNEAVIVVGTKKDIPYFTGMDRWKIENTPGPKLKGRDFVRWLLGIERDQRVIAVDGYTVSAKTKGGLF